jgi:D-proline reductase (dithiol) PrdD
MNKEIILRKLTIKAFHIDSVVLGNKNGIDNNVFTIDESILKSIYSDIDLVVDMKLDIIKPGEYDREINTIMDIVPISTKVLGGLGEGITHTLTGTYVMLTGADENGKQMAEFGSSEGNLREQMKLGKAGTPSEKDIIIHIDVTLKGDQIYNRELPLAAFKVSDTLIQNYRNVLKTLNGRSATESHDFLIKLD